MSKSEDSLDKLQMSANLCPDGDQCDKPEFLSEDQPKNEDCKTTSSAASTDIVHIFANDDLIKKIICRGNSFYGKPDIGHVAVLDLEGKIKNTNLSICSNQDLHIVVGEADVVTGLDVAVATMEHGEKALIYVHHRYAYREFPCGDIPPNSDLEFVVELKRFFPMPYETDHKLCTKICLRKKDVANQYYKDRDFIASHQVYNSALKHLQKLDTKESNSLKNTILSNMSIVLMKLKKFDEALKCLEGISLVSHMDSRYYYRKSQCLQALMRYHAALSVAEIGLSLFPMSNAIRRDLLELRNILKSHEQESGTFFKKMFYSPKKSPSSSNSSFPSSFIYGCAVLAVGAGIYLWHRM